MTEERVDRRHGRRYMKRQLLTWIPGVAICAAAWWFLREGNVGGAVFAVAAFVVLWAVGMWWQSRNLKRFTCPDCGRLIVGPVERHPGEDEHYRYYCPDCDVIWKTRLVEGGVSG